MRRPPIPVRSATLVDRPVAAGILARAFIDDPAMAYLFRRADRRPARLQRFFTTITGIDPDPDLWSLAADPAGTMVATALWRPPGAWATPSRAILAELPALLRTFGSSLVRALALQALMDRHHPAAPHWYLQFAGCVPESQGCGYGGAAIRAGLARADAAQLPCALETATPANIGLYQSLGFAVTKTYAPRRGPRFWTMWREPQLREGRP